MRFSLFLVTFITFLSKNRKKVEILFGGLFSFYIYLQSKRQLETDNG